MDFAGRIVGTLRATSLQDSTTIINVSALPKGVYMLLVYTDSGVDVKKVGKGINNQIEKMKHCV
jgi:hypothetical protein